MADRIATLPKLPGTLRLKDYKAASLLDQQIYVARPPSVVRLPLWEGLGRPAKPVVSPGDAVRLGQKIAEPDGEDSSAVHASVSGQVVSIGPGLHPFLGLADVIEIKNDGADLPDIGMIPRKDSDRFSAEELLALVREAGLVELDGAPEPLCAKLAAARQSGVQTLIVNACESQPFLTALHLLMLNRASDILRGVLLLKRILEHAEIFLVVGDDKMDALEVLGSKLYALSIAGIRLLKAPARFPMSEPVMLCEAVRRRSSQRQFKSERAVVIGMATCLALAEAVYLGKPLYERVITVAGAPVAKPRNTRVRIGASLSSVLQESGGLLRTPRLVLVGDPMKGSAQPVLDVPVTKQTSAVLALVEETRSLKSPAPCIRCSACDEVCPAGVLPSVLSLAAETRAFDLAREQGIARCMECGNCSYVCPSERPMLGLLQFAKRNGQSC